MHTLLFSKDGSVSAMPTIFRPLYFLGVFTYDISIGAIPEREKGSQGEGENCFELPTAAPRPTATSIASSASQSASCRELAVQAAPQPIATSIASLSHLGQHRDDIRPPFSPLPTISLIPYSCWQTKISELKSRDFASNLTKTRLQV